MPIEVREDGRTASSPSAEPEHWEGRPPEPRADQVQKLRLPPSPNFVYLAHPFRWDVAQVDDSLVVVPFLRELRFEPGVCNVKAERNKANGDPALALVTLARKGWIEIPADIEVPTAAGREKGYVRMYTGWQGPVHLPIWTRPVGLAGQVVLKHDLENFNRFRAELLKHKVISPPDPTVLDAMAVRFRSAVHGRMHTKRGKAEFEAEVYMRKLHALDQPRRAREVSDGK